MGILAALPTEYKRILPRLEHVLLKRGEIVYRADQDIKAVYSASQWHAAGTSAEQRLARWLLTMDDYAASREFLMDHQSIAAMLGVRRVGISEAAHRLRKASLVDYRRGRITVLDRRALQKKSCECYRFIRREYESLTITQDQPQWWPTLVALHAAPYLDRYPGNHGIGVAMPGNAQLAGELRAILREVEAAFQ